MDLSTTYLGLPLAHPLMTGASPLVDRLDLVKRLEDAGASAITMHSLFEEQIAMEQRATVRHIETHADSFAEALSYFPDPDDYRLGPDEYLEHIQRIKSVVDVPVIASLNGSSGRGWIEYAKAIQSAGADALELNIYLLATDPRESGSSIEDRVIQVARSVTDAVRIPVAVKLSPFFSSLSHLAARLDQTGVKGLVLFNRFYQPDIDVEELEVVRSLRLSDSSELLLRLRWLAVLSGRVQASLAVTGGVHTVLDAVKAIMCGAHAVQMVSALLQHGPGQLKSIISGVSEWLEAHEYESLAQMQGSMSLLRCPDSDAYERANYASVLRSWRH